MNQDEKSKPISSADKEAISDVRRTLIQARLPKEIWWTIEGEHPRRSDIVRALNFYPGFFGALSPATFIAYVLGIASLFDRNPKSVSLRSIPGIDSTEGFDALWTEG